MKRTLLFSILLMLLALPIFATPEEEEAIEAAKNYRLNIKNCPTLEFVTNQQLVDIRWSNPGGGDKTFCYAKVSGFQKNNNRFDATFIYSITEKKIEPFSVRLGTREIFKKDVVQKELMKLFSTCSNDVWLEMKRPK